MGLWVRIVFAIGVCFVLTQNASAAGDAEGETNPNIESVNPGETEQKVSSADQARPEAADIFVEVKPPPDGPEMPKPGSIQADGLSAVLNTSLVYSRSEFNALYDKSVFDEIVLNFEPSVRSEALGGITIRSEGRVVWDHDFFQDMTGAYIDQSVDFQRGFTTLTKDFTGSAIRLTLGDVFARPVSFQGSSRILGVSIARDYRAIQPRRNVLPTSRKRFLIERPSRVQIFADNSLVRQEFLSPGSFDIESFANELGTQRIELEIRDDTGRTERIRFSSLTSIPRLSAGILDFGFAAGVPSVGRIDGPEYFFDQAVVSGFVQYGLSSDINIGADFQADKDAAMLGGSAILSSLMGSFSVRGGLNRLDGGIYDYAVGASYASPILGDYPRITMDFEYFGENFSRIGEQNFQSTDTFYLLEDPQYAVTGSVSHSLTNKLNLSVGGDWRRLRPNPSSPFGSPYFTERWSSYMAADYRISKKLAISATFSADKFNNDIGRKISAYISLRRYFGDQVTADVSYNTRSNATALSMSRDPKHSINRTFAQVRAEHINSQPDAYSISADVDYLGNRFSAYGYHFEDRTVGDATTRDSYIQLNSAIAFADGDFAIGRQVNGTGYAVVNGFPQAPEDAVYIDDWGDGEYRAKSDAFGPALVNDIIPYINDTLSVTTRAPKEDAEESEPASEEDEEWEFFSDPPETDLSDEIPVFLKPYGGVTLTPNDGSEETGQSIEE